jgi:antitoxin VapB
VISKSSCKYTGALPAGDPILGSEGKARLVYTAVYTRGLSAIPEGGLMNTAKVFANGRSQAVRLPKEFQFTADEVYIHRVGGVVMLFPREEAWESLARSLEHFTEDFMAVRDQGAAPEERKAL